MSDSVFNIHFYRIEKDIEIKKMKESYTKLNSNNQINLIYILHRKIEKRHNFLFNIFSILYRQN